MPKTVSTDAPSSPADLRKALRNIQQALCDYLHNTATLAIAATTSKVKTSAAVRYTIDGALYYKAATDNFWTLAGTVTNAKFNVFVLTINAAGAAGAYMGTEGATRAAVVFPAIPAGEVVLGYVEINPTGTGNFVGGTTPLGDATVVPNAAYVNTPYPFNPNLLTLPNEYLA